MSQCIICAEFEDDDVGVKANFNNGKSSNAVIPTICPEVFKNYSRLLNAGSNPLFQFNLHLESPLFCKKCWDTALRLDHLQRNLIQLQKNVDQVRLRAENILLISLTKHDGKIDFCKRVARGEIKFEIIVPLDKVDFYRSIVALEFNPAVYLDRCDVTTKHSRDRHFPPKSKRILFSFTRQAIIKLPRKVDLEEGELIVRSDNKLTEEEQQYYYPAPRKFVPDRDRRPYIVLTMEAYGPMCLTCKTDYTIGKSMKHGAALDKSYTCKVCNATLKAKRNAFRHSNEVHRHFKAFKCKYCEKEFSQRSNAESHILRAHKEERRILVAKRNSKAKESMQRTGRRCLQCYEMCKDNAHQTSSQIMDVYSGYMKVQQLYHVFQWDFDSADTPVFCEPCFIYVLQLTNLTEELRKCRIEINNIIVNIKSAILLEMPEEQEVRQFYRKCNSRHPKNTKISLNNKIDFFRSSAVQDFAPEVDKIVSLSQEPAVEISNGVNYKPIRRRFNNERATHKNSIFALLQESEIIVLDPNIVGFSPPLNEEEFQKYLLCANDTFLCKMCSTKLSCVKTAIAHVNKVHKGIRRFKCKYCPKKFYHRNQCAYHVLEFHEEERKNIPMKNPIQKSSGKIESNRRADSDGIIELDNNTVLPPVQIIRTLSGFQCSICSVVLKRKENVSRHQRTVHFNIARFQCSFCGFKELGRSTVVNHIRRTHSDKLPEEALNNLPKGAKQMLAKRNNHRYRIPVIGPQEPIRPLELKNHCVEKDYKCTGSGYECNICGMSYPTKVKILDHVENRHYGVRKYECKVCGKKCFTLVLSRRHVRKCHPNYSTELSEPVQGNNAEIASKKESLLPDNKNDDVAAPEFLQNCSEGLPLFPKVEVMDGLGLDENTSSMEI